MTLKVLQNLVLYCIQKKSFLTFKEKTRSYEHEEGSLCYYNQEAKVGAYISAATLFKYLNKNNVQYPNKVKSYKMCIG